MTNPIGRELFSFTKRHGSAPPVWPLRTARGTARRLAALPPTFFATALGLAGLGLTWRVAATVVDAPRWVAAVLFAAAAAVWFVLVVGLLLRLVSNSRAVTAQLADPLLSPFMAVPAVIVMLLAVGLRPYAEAAANIIALAGLTVTIALGGWLAGQWIAGKIDPAQIHPGYFLPTVAGGFVGANVMGVIGHRCTGWPGSACCWSSRSCD